MSLVQPAADEMLVTDAAPPATPAALPASIAARPPRPLPTALLLALLLFLLNAGATYNGILTPDIRQATTTLLVLASAAWLLLRWVLRWRWFATPLDFAVIAWAGVLLASTLANIDDVRRIAIGLWFIGAYSVGWFVLSDMQGNHAIDRTRIALALLLAGLVPLFFGLTQSLAWAGQTLPAIVEGSAPFVLPRPVSTLGNPNTFAGVLVVLLPLAAAGAFASRGVARWAWAAYTLVAGGLLLLTYSRGGWVGGAVALLLLLLAAVALSGGWAWVRAHRRLVLGLAALLLLVALGGVVFLLTTLDDAGRSLDLRTFLYESALTVFAQNPIAGRGPYMFGAELARLNSTPPTEVHAHAHNLILHVAAETGLLGLLALLFTGWLLLRAAMRNQATLAALFASQGGAAQPAQRIARERMIVWGGIAAVCGFVLHHQFDVPSSNPAVALALLPALLVAVAPVRPLPLAQAPYRGRLVLAHGVTIGVGTLLLAGIALLAALNYAAYQRGLALAYRPPHVIEDPYLAAADAMLPVIANDPLNPVPLYERGLLMLLSPSALPENAVVAFERFTALAPAYSVGWANLAAAYSASGRSGEAMAAAGQAASLAPDTAIYWYNLGRYAEAASDPIAAADAYSKSLVLQPDFMFMPTWDDSPVRRAASAGVARTPLAQVTQALLDGDPARARAVWDREIEQPNSARAHAVHAWLLRSEGDAAAAHEAWEAARRSVPPQPVNYSGEAWLLFVRSRLAALDGEDDAAAGLLAEAVNFRPAHVLYNDDPSLLNIFHTQLLHLALPRVLAPQVLYDMRDPLLEYALLRTLQS